MTRRLSSHPDFPVPTGRQTLHFTFNGRDLTGLDGDTIASALLANGVDVVSRSFKYHRPRGYSDGHGRGAELLVDVDGTPNVAADMVTLEEGMTVSSQNAWPSVGFDIMGVNNVVVPRLPNQFYYKMLHKPRALWPLAEKAIRRAAGIGRINTKTDYHDVRYEKRYRFPDVCVIGGGLAGLVAAVAASEADAEVLLVEEQPRLGGHLLHSAWKCKNTGDERLDGLPAHEAAQVLVEDVRSRDNIEVLTGATVFGLYEQNLVAAYKGNDQFKIRAESVVVATGAGDRHLVFENNDIPGVVTARGVERLIAIHGVAIGTTAVVTTTHDGGYHTAAVLQGAGLDVTVVDTRRTHAGSPMAKRVADSEATILHEQIVVEAKGKKAVKAALVQPLGGGKTTKLPCDLLVTAVGYSPNIRLLAMGRKRPYWDASRQVLQAHLAPDARIYAAGEVLGWGRTGTLIEEAKQVGRAATEGELAVRGARGADEVIAAPPPDVGGRGSRHFICKCMDVTRKEVLDSIEEGFDQVETLKRFTSMGMGPCQGKSCAEAVARIAAIDTDTSDGQPVPTTYRPPVRPVSFGVLAGRSAHLVPIRRTAMHACHRRLGATFMVAGQWLRPEHYGDPGAEARHVRESLGLIDVSTLGKIEIAGPQALDFLHFMLPGKFAKLGVGRTRYTIMIGEDGQIYEDGTLSRLDEDVYYLSTTTGNQDAILSTFWWWLTTDEYDVRIRNLGPVNAAVNVAGASSREFLETVVDGIDLSNEAFPFMSARQGRILNVPAILFRIGFTGEHGYEIHFPAEYGAALWDELLQVGDSFGLRPFGVEAQRRLRLEKAHIICGIDTDALTDPWELGLAFAVKPDKPDFVGRSLVTQLRQRGADEKLVQFVLDEGSPIPPDGVAVVRDDRPVGRVTSCRVGPATRSGVGLAWVPTDLADPDARLTIRMPDGSDVQGRVLPHAVYDPDRLRLKV